MGMLYDIFDDAAGVFDRDVALRNPMTLFERAVNTNWDGHVLYADRNEDGLRCWVEAFELSPAGSRRHAKALGDAAASAGGGSIVTREVHLTEAQASALFGCAPRALSDTTVHIVASGHDEMRDRFLDDPEAVSRHARKLGAEAGRLEKTVADLERRLDDAPSLRSRELRVRSIGRMKERARALREQESSWLDLADVRG